MALARSRLIDVGAPSAEALIAALPTALLVLDGEGCIASVNAAAEMLLNASAAHLLHKPLGIVLRVPPACYDGLREESVFAAYDCQLETARGLRFRADFHATPLGDHPGWRLVTLQSATAAQAMGQQFDRRDRSRSAIGAAAMLAHEIKNPLSGIRGAAQLLDAHVGEGGRDMTRLIRDEVDRVTALIDRMEAFTDSRPVERTAQNLYAILEHARAVAAAGFGDRIDIHDAYDPSLPPVFVHRDSLVQVLLNLIKNAAEAVPEGRRGTVTLTTRYRHGVSVGGGSTRRALPIEVGVVDDGPGPADEIVDHLFEPFVSSKSSGRGLGLALVDKLVRDNGGIIQFARNGSPPKSVFRILLPRADRGSAA
jgi:two-component system nitrogen regulation sensor histidine kinase GlnL